MSTTVLTTSLNDQEDKYVPWKALKPTVSESGKVCPPLFTKLQRQKKPGSTKRVTFSMFPELP